MTALLTVVETASYLSKAERILTPQERQAIVDSIAAAPSQGAVVRGLGGIRKMRIGMGGRGKRGGGRVIYWFHSGAYPAVLLWVFAKNEAGDLTAAQSKMLKSVADALLEDFGG